MIIKKAAFILWIVLLSIVINAQAQEKPKIEKNDSGTSQCLAKKKNTEDQCKSMTKNESGYCHMHKAQDPDYKLPAKSDYKGQCTAKTASGKQCTRQAKEGFKMCWQHL